jgi:hypothetical protein
MVESGAGSGSLQTYTDPDADPGGQKKHTGSYDPGSGSGTTVYSCNIPRLSLEMESLIWTGFSE